MTDSLTKELANAGNQPSLTPELLELEKNRITSRTVLPPMEFLFSLFGEPCFPRRELVAFTGRAKSGNCYEKLLIIRITIMCAAMAA